MNVVPSFLRPAAKQEPAEPRLPFLDPAEMTPDVAAFVNATAERRRELAYLRSENEQLDRELKLSNEKGRMLETELAHVRDERDALYRAVCTLRQGLRGIKIAIIDLEDQSRAEEYAPVGTGHQEPAADEQIDHAAELAKKLAAEPEGKTDGA